MCWYLETLGKGGGWREIENWKPQEDNENHPAGTREGGEKREEDTSWAPPPQSVFLKSPPNASSMRRLVKKIVRAQDQVGTTRKTLLSPPPRGSKGKSRKLTYKTTRAGEGEQKNGTNPNFIKGKRGASFQLPRSASLGSTDLGYVGREMG